MVSSLNQAEVNLLGNPWLKFLRLRQGANQPHDMKHESASILQKFCTVTATELEGNPPQLPSGWWFGVNLIYPQEPGTINPNHQERVPEFVGSPKSLTRKLPWLENTCNIW